VSTTALHWLSLPDLVRCYRSVAAVLRPGGVLLNGDRFDFGADQASIARVAAAAQPEWPPLPEGAEDWERWWRAVLAAPDFAAPARERARRGHDHPHGDEVHSYDFHRAALLASGFREVGTLWQHLANRVLVAVR
jgi:hypothetical protein